MRARPDFVARARAAVVLAAALLTAACGVPDEDPAPDAGAPDAGSNNPCVGPADAGEKAPDAFADRVVDFHAGAAAGFGQQKCPANVLGPPKAPGGGQQSLDVLSLGREGSLVLEFTDVGVVDGPGVDLLVFENPLEASGGGVFTERGHVAVSEDGQTWHEFPCERDNADGGYPFCAGVHLVYAPGADGEVSPTDPRVAGGDGFDLADLGLGADAGPMRFVRIRDSGSNEYLFPSGGFDLDAVAVVNGAPLDGGTR